MTFQLQGTYVENCNCDVICPCTWSSLSRAATHDRCNVVLVAHIDRGEIDGIDVSGLSVGFIADTPAVMSQGGWRMGLLLDGAAEPEQLDRLRRFMAGEFGGVPAALGPLVGRDARRDRRAHPVPRRRRPSHPPCRRQHRHHRGRHHQPRPRPGRCQAAWLHAVPKVRGRSRSRVSAQWRWTSRRGRRDPNPSYYAPRHFSR